jgi:hypothetical protein
VHQGLFRKFVVAGSKLTSQEHARILQRLDEIASELARSRAELKSLRSRDSATSQVVTRGARLYSERTQLERILFENNVS